MNKKILMSTILLIMSSKALMAGCSNGLCVATVPRAPTNMGNESVFNTDKDKKYNGWIIADNAGDESTGENRLMAGGDINSILAEGDKFSFFGLVTDESLLSGKAAYRFKFLDTFALEGGYINSNYNLGEPFPGATGIGTTSTFEGKLIYSPIEEDMEKLNLSIELRNNNIEEEIDSGFFVFTQEKKSYTGTANLNYEVKNNMFFDLKTYQKLKLGATIGDLSFDDPFAEEIDDIGLQTKGTFSKINIDYKNEIYFNDELSLSSKFKGQCALDDKNLDDSESISVGGIEGVKLYEEGSVYSSNGLLVNIEGKYKLPEFNGLKNKIGIFYDYGEVWDSGDYDNKIAVQDAGVGLYTQYEGFFSKVQGAFKINDADIPTKGSNDYRILVQAGFSF